MRHDKDYFLSELARLFDPGRIHRVHGIFPDDSLIVELRRYYAALEPEAKEGFLQAVRTWLWSGDELRRMQAIRLCGDARLRGCVDDLLRLGKMLRHRSPEHPELFEVIHSLGLIGYVELLPFLVFEATGGPRRGSAVMATAESDPEQALGLVPAAVDEYYRNGLRREAEFLLAALLADPKRARARELGHALHALADRKWLVERFRVAAAMRGYDRKGRYLTRKELQRLVDCFIQALYE